MKKSFFLILVLFVVNGFSQENSIGSTVENLLPISIYTSTFNMSSPNRVLKVDGNLELTSVKLDILDIESAKNGLFSISTMNIGKKSTKFMTDMFQEIALSKGMESAFFDLDKLYNRDNCPKNN